ncbi:MAG: nicotinate phosphoribosyltransferase [Acidobacteriota bacterium]|jgi:nicotinate phosphoribosyltransferase|nr:nicotinate phosphoribosyltransferase [Acidobacteriota bacterium]
MATLNIDRYHAAMGDASYKDATRLHGKSLSDAEATFYVTQRKLPFAPCLGHERLVRSLIEGQIDRPRVRFLEQDRGGLKLFADAIEDMHFVGAVRAVRPATIVFAQEPFADITGPFGLTQAQEIKFEHAFDLPMTTASLAMQFRMAAGTRWLSDFSLRRNGDIERAVEVTTYAFIGGFNDTSNMEAAHRLDIPAVGTEAHYWQQSYLEFMYEPEIEPRTGQPKHFEQVAFERWLDANPNGTTLLLDTIDVHMGAVHAAMAATSTETRRRAFKGFRVDSGDLAELGRWCLEFFEANGLHGLMPILTGDLDVEKLQRIVEEFPQATGFGVGTKLSSEVSRIAGVIFKECLIENLPTLKASNSPDKVTLPGRLQIFRGMGKDGKYVADIIGLDDEVVEVPDAVRTERLLVPFWEHGRYDPIPSIKKQKAFVEEQRARFTDINNYPCSLSDRLRELRDGLTAQMREDHSGWQDILKLPEALAAELDGKK